MLSWAKSQGIKGLQAEIVRLPEKTPVILIEVAPTDPASSATVLMYGHLDKQPPLTGWLPGLGPYTPVLRDGKVLTPPALNTPHCP